MEVTGVTQNSFLFMAILPVILAALHSMASARLGSLNVRYRTTPPAELNPQMAHHRFYHHKQNTGMVWSFFICTISSKMVLSTSW
jgi:hypothetical protein